MAFRCRYVASATLCLGLSACAYRPLTRSSIGYKVSGSLGSEAAAAGESNLFVHGWLLRPAELRDKEVFVVATAKVKEEIQVVVVMPVGKAGHYGMYLPAADYELTAFIDENDDGTLDNQEVFGRRKGGLSLKSDGPSVLLDVDIEMQPRAIEEASVLSETETVRDLLKPDVQVGEELFAERYASEIGTLGLVNPNEFLQRVEQLQFIEEPDFTDDRVPIVFVHGIDGTPQVFERLEEGLDQKRFQPWFFYFPSGARLPSSAELLHYYFFSGRFLPKMKRMGLTAHSMGGLVARGALNAYKRARSPSPLPFFASFVTPYGGVEAANIGIRNSPFRVPSWVDVASGSDYQSHLFTGLPQGMSFHLIAGNSEGDSDGTIPLSSQRYEPALAEAATVEMFPRDHVGIMGADDALSAYFRRLTPLARDVSVETPIGSLERLRRAKAFFSAVESRLVEEGIEIRFSRVTETCQRLSLKKGDRQLIVRLSVGRGLRAEILAPEKRSHAARWPEARVEVPSTGVEAPEAIEGKITAANIDGQDDDGTTSKELGGGAEEKAERPASDDPPILSDGAPRIVSSADEAVRLTKVEFTEALMTDVRQLLAAPAGSVLSPEPLAAPLPVAPHIVDPTPPPMHLFLGFLGTVNPGRQFLTLRVPVELAMYWGALGIGTDLRLPLLSPVIQAEGGDLTFNPFGIALGPRLRFGAQDSFLVGNLGANLMTEFGRVRMTAPGSGRPLSFDDLVDETSVGGLGISGSGHVGFRLSQDFYFRIGGDLGSLFQPLRVRIGDEEIVLFQRPFLNILAGLEVRIP